VGDEVESYERRLIDEWERFAAALTEELDGTASEIELKRVGRQIFNWMEQTADLRIRPNVSELYVMRGSFHILANKPAPSVFTPRSGSEWYLCPTRQHTTPPRPRVRRNGAF
jgi:hypothetical protein